MANLIIKLIGDEWHSKERIAISIPATRPFNASASRFAEKLGLDSFGPPWTLYHTEQSTKKDFARATIPIESTSTPTKEKLRTGSLLYVKEADLGRQDADRQFQATLEQWRKEKGQNPTTPLEFGADVFKFEAEFAKTLNVKDATYLSELEQEKRDVIEGENVRMFWALTYEVRQSAILKEEEEEQREKLFAKACREANDLFHDTVSKPLQKFARARVEAAQTAAREKIVAEEKPEREEFYSQAKARLEVVRREEREKQMMQLAQAQAQAAAAANAKAAGISKDELEHIVGKLKEVVQESRKEMQAEVTNVVSDLVKQVREESALQREAVRSSLAQQNDAAERLHNVATYVNNRAVNERGTHMRERLEELALPASYATPSNPADIAKMKLLLHEQNELMKALKDAEQLAEQDDARAAGLSETHVTATIVSSVQQVQDRLLRHMEQLAEDSSAAGQKGEEGSTPQHSPARKHSDPAASPPRWSKTFHFSYRAERLAAGGGTGGLHPDAFGIFVDFLCKYDEFASETLRDPTSPLPPDLQAQSADGELDQRVIETLSGISIRCAGDPWLMADELVFRYAIVSSTQRAGVHEVCETYTPHVCCVLDLLLDVYAGREAEIAAAMVGSVNSGAASLPQQLKLQSPSGSSGDHSGFAMFLDDRTGRPYYYHEQVRLTQWLRPRGFGTGEFAR